MIALLVRPLSSIGGSGLWVEEADTFAPLARRQKEDAGFCQCRFDGLQRADP